MRTDNLDYFRRRAEEETRAAAACTDEAVATAHRKMAEEYRKRVDGPYERPLLRQVR